MAFTQPVPGALGASTTPASASVPSLVHQRRLVGRRRCPHCAELQRVLVWLRGGTCRRCGGSLRLVPTDHHAQTVLASLGRDARTTRTVAYAGVFVANLLVSWVPMLATVVTALGMVIANLWLVRRPTAWLPVQHRMLVRMMVRAWFVVMIAVDLHANLLAAPLITWLGLGIAVSTGSGLLVTALYVEGALLLVRARVRRAVAQPDADWGCLTVPVGFAVTGVLLFLAGIPLLQRVLSGAGHGGP